MSRNNTTDCSTHCENERMVVSRILPYLDCSWSLKDVTCKKQKMATRDASHIISIQSISYPCLSLGGTHEDDEFPDSTLRREEIHSKASKLLSRRLGAGTSDWCSNRSPPQIMLENIVDSLDHLVDARIRAYTLILQNHVRALRESNNIEGARVAEYKLETLLEIAASHVLFDSISTEFRIANNNNNSKTTRGQAARERTTTPVELIVEIKSPRFGSTDAREGKIVFQAKGEILVGPNNDTSSCASCSPHPEDEDDVGSTSLRCQCQVVFQRPTINNTKTRRRKNNYYYYKNSNFSSTIVQPSPSTGVTTAEVHINCEDLLSQMMDGASTIVSMAIELTNAAWKTNMQKSEEPANIVVDDDDEYEYDDNINRSPPQQVSRKRARFDLTESYHRSNNNNNKARLVHHVSEISLLPRTATNDKLHLDDDNTDDDYDSSSSNSASKRTPTITNMHILHRDKKDNCYVSVEPSSESSTSSVVGDDWNHHPQDTSCNSECYSQFLAERAGHIVDFALAGNVLPAGFSTNKRLRST